MVDRAARAKSQREYRARNRVKINQYMREYRARNGDKLRAYEKEHRMENQQRYARPGRDRRNLRYYGLSPDQYDAMLIASCGHCAVCLQPSSTLSVDHDHASGQVRGLLCNSCNLALGHLKDSVELCQLAGRYLLAYQEAA